jgi:hypothetical protein
MQIPYVRKAKQPRQSPWKTEDGFRLIRAFSIEHNARRFSRHVDRLDKEDRRTQSGRRFTIKLRRIRRAQA